MKSLLQLHRSVLFDIGRQCSIDIARDWKTVSGRCEDEGDSYLTITLPKFARALERGLDTGCWPKRGDLPEFRYHRGLPVFMRGFLLRVFDESGYLVPDPDTDCIRNIRQFCLLTQKVERECTPERIRRAFTGFVSTDRELMGLPGRLDPARLLKFEKVSRRLFGDMFQHCDRVIAEFGLIPRHGAGAVAERISQKEKRSYDYWTDRLESVFPSWRYTTNSRYRSSVTVAPDSEIPVRVIAVPKTQSTPRIIAIEPSSVQYAQQGLKREIYEWIGRGPLSKILGFSDQLRNQEMAREASLSGRFATLDLSEASDRIHWYLVYRMLKPYPHLWEFAWATRSHRADVPGFGVLPLQKYASMGSANTFPFEAMIFTILAVLGARDGGGITSFSPRHLAGRISVYGDDIIVPVGSVDAVIDWLEHFGAKVNQHKSFWNGKFRESCGAEYYDGHDVTVVRARAELPSSRRDAAEIAALIDLRNRMFIAGMWGVVRDLDEELESLIELPYVSVTQTNQVGYLHRVTSVTPALLVERMNPHLQREEFRAPMLISSARTYRADGESGLLEWFHSVLRREDIKDRYDSQERATSFSIQRRWTPSHIMTGGPG